MSTDQFADITEMIDTVQDHLERQDLVAVANAVAPMTLEDTILLLERLAEKQRAVVYRLLPKNSAIEVFERLDPVLQGELIHALQDSEVATIFAGLDPDD